MALYKISLDIVVKNARLFSVIGQRVGQSWFGKFKELPAFSALEHTADMNNEQWTNLRKEMLESKAGMKTPSLDITILQLCIASKNLDLGKSYLKYLEENEYDVNMAVVAKYFQLLYNSKNTCTDIDKKQILDMYDNLRLKHQLLDAVTAESCILAISLTERWKDAMELLEMIKLSATASSISYSAIIASSFDHGEPEIGWKYLNELTQQQKTPHSVAYIAYINYCSKNFKEPDACVQEIGKLFHFIADHDLLPNENVMKHIKKTFQTLGWKGNFVKLSNVGVCWNCNHQLASLKLSDEDFSHLSKTVLDKVIVGNNIYFKSTPFELKKFVNFVDKTKPYDIVLDGLNVGYKAKKYTPSNAAKQLASVVRYFLDKNQVVLVLGRRHMMKWDYHTMKYVKNNTFLFLTDDLSSDDPCLLYATLASGPETKFVSSDLMRQHKCIIKDIALQRMFKRWQMSHQCFLFFKKDQPLLTPPLNYSPTAQGGENCWHVPYKSSETPLTESYEPPSNWLCLNRVQSSCK